MMKMILMLVMMMECATVFVCFILERSVLELSVGKFDGTLQCTFGPSSEGFDGGPRARCV